MILDSSGGTSDLIPNKVTAAMTIRGDRVRCDGPWCSIIYACFKGILGRKYGGFPTDSEDGM